MVAQQRARIQSLAVRQGEVLRARGRSAGNRDRCDQNEVEKQNATSQWIAAFESAANAPRGSLRVLLLRRLRLQIRETAVDGVHLADQLLFHLLAIAARHDAKAGGVLHHVGGKREQTRDQALILE